MLQQRRFWPGLSVVVASLLILAGFRVGAAQTPVQTVDWDLPIRIPSPEDSSSWFPDLAVDRRGNVHVIWSETQTAQEGMGESVYYSTWNGSRWTQYVDIVAPSPDIRRTSMAIDAQDTVHLLYGGTQPGQVYRLSYKKAPAGLAYSSANWSEPQYLNDRGETYMSDVAVYGSTLHILYDDSGAPGGSCSGCADIYYRYSTDLGTTWSVPTSLYPTLSGSARPHLFVDQNGGVYASWDEGWDRLTGKGLSESGLMVSSKDGGVTWSDPISVTYPNSTNVQLTVAANGDSGVMLLWRTRDVNYPGIYYMWSGDGGASWSQPEALPNFLAVPFVSLYDAYDMAADSAGHIHLLAAGYPLANERASTPGAAQGAAGLYHFEWDGARWYPANLVYRGGWLPEYPRIVIEQGNELHATWALRRNAADDLTPHQIMYAHGRSASPRLELNAPGQVGASTDEGTNGVTAPLSPTQAMKAEPSPTWEPATPASSGRLSTEMDDYLLILASLVPVVALIVGVAVAFRKRKR